MWGFRASFFKGTEAQSAERCSISQKHSDHDSQTSLQAVVTNDQFLAAQFKGSRTCRLLKLVKRAVGNKDGERETGAKVTPERYNYSCETGTVLYRHGGVSALQFRVSLVTKRLQR